MRPKRENVGEWAAAVARAAEINAAHGIAWIAVPTAGVYDVVFFEPEDVMRAAGTSALKELARWLVSLDDPSDPIGLAARRTVTLSEICERARRAQQVTG